MVSKWVDANLKKKENYETSLNTFWFPVFSEIQHYASAKISILTKISVLWNFVFLFPKLKIYLNNKIWECEALDCIKKGVSKVLWQMENWFE